ncbi:thioredoxin TrxC [Cobetia marina]|jgi:thioredoxin 2|uniref:Thioredoxin n=1 Tax=Cobetia marina TaxID=28258 RepID=A0ABU9GHR1_COBMA|nr:MULTISPECIES: thioredoxin TrxC [Cobetia]AOM00708.1 thioredoxin [Cobetia marina]AZV30789.1 thioredoxin TrxC [Cobetia sp. ICG0124]MDA5562627.1 thioredoxin TrxC [Cobetia sp. MMG027]MDH2373073.1 thioredoxin TrxC [Cobetia sp. 3AK]MDI6002702.1 thioredoxin TrxC [Cobetia pacifica]
MSESLVLACPQCLALNRVATARLDDNPVCGKCSAAVLPQEPLELTSANFEALVTRSEMPVVIDFWASWCGPCKMMGPIFNEVAAQMGTRVRFAKIDTEAQQALAGRFGIRSIPTLLVMKQGKELARESGVMQAGQLKQWLAPHAV